MNCTPDAPPRFHRPPPAPSRRFRAPSLPSQSTFCAPPIRPQDVIKMSEELLEAATKLAADSSTGVPTLAALSQPHPPDLEYCTHAMTVPSTLPPEI